VRDDAGQEYVVAPVVLPTGIVGYVWVAALPSRRSGCEDEIVSYAAAACALEMVRQRAMMEGESRVRNSFLEDLLTGTVTSNTSTRRRARYLGYDLRGEQIVFVLDLDQFAQYFAAHGLDESGIQRLKQRFRHSVEACLPAIWNRTMIWEHSDSIVVLAPVGKDVTSSTLQERVDAVRRNVEKRLDGPSISAGVGRAYADLGRLQHSYREAEHALRIGTACSGPGSATAFDALGVYRLLYHLREQPELEFFCEETIGCLERYDEEHGSHLLATLACFLDLQGNLSQTARSLHLHRNGLLYRLSRIEKIAACDLNSPTQRLAIQIALLARPLVHHKHRIRQPSALH
jgi:purine catabolism regulator